MAIKHVVYVLVDKHTHELLEAYETYAGATQERNNRAVKKYGHDSWFDHYRDDYDIIEVTVYGRQQGLQGVW